MSRGWAKDGVVLFIVSNVKAPFGLGVVFRRVIAYGAHVTSMVRRVLEGKACARTICFWILLVLGKRE